MSRCTVCEHADGSLVRLVSRKARMGEISNRTAAKALQVPVEAFECHLRGRCENLLVDLETMGISEAIPRLIKRLMQWVNELEEAPLNTTNVRILTALAKEVRGQIRDLKELEHLERSGSKVEQQLVQVNLLVNDITAWMVGNLCRGPVTCPHCGNIVKNLGCLDSYIAYQSQKEKGLTNEDRDY